MIKRIKYGFKKRMNIGTSYFLIIGLFSIFLFVGGFSLALFTAEVERRGTLNIITGNLYSFLESEGLNASNRIEVEAGESRDITIYLKNPNPIEARFNLWYEAAEGVSVSYDHKKDMPPQRDGTVLGVDASKTYQLRITNNTSNKETIRFGSEAGLSNSALLFPEGGKIIDQVIPKIKLDSGMIPVVYNGSTWVKASSSDWYDYDIGKWANAVTVTSSSRSKYQSASSGVEVLMSDIETMWVYIPRYSYTIGSMDGENYYGKQGIYLDSVPTLELPGEIDIKFIEKDEKDTGSAQYKVSEGVSGWRTPDAFTFGGEELAGLWVGKFETSSNDPSTQYGGGNNTALSPIIRPNRANWRNINVSNIGEVSRKISVSGNSYYGVSTAMDSHAMKNSEWGVVAYLSQSKYGKLGNKDYQGSYKEVFENKAYDFKTGCSYGKNPDLTSNYACHYTYEKSPEGTGASTTGTIYGVYDMAGGAWDYVMANYAPGGTRYSSYDGVSTSGYTGIAHDGTHVVGKDWLEDHYYNFYTDSDSLLACDNQPCLSHALHELSGWYQNGIGLPGRFPWAVRGGTSYDTKIRSGLFTMASVGGNNSYIFSFRLVLISL